MTVGTAGRRGGLGGSAIDRRRVDRLVRTLIRIAANVVQGIRERLTGRSTSSRRILSRVELDGRDVRAIGAECIPLAQFRRSNLVGLGISDIERPPDGATEPHVVAHSGFRCGVRFLGRCASCDQDRNQPQNDEFRLHWNSPCAYLRLRLY